MAISDFVRKVAADVLEDVLRKYTGTGKRRTRRKRTVTASERLKKIEKLLKPARKQVSRKRTVRARAKTKRRAS